MMKLNLLAIIFLAAAQLQAQSFEKVDNVVTESAEGSRAATFVDVDNDGWLDIFVTNGPENGENNRLFINDGTGEFEENGSTIISDDMSPSDGATWGDMDNDGRIDLFVVTWYGKKNYLYHQRKGDFSESSSIESSGFSETASWGDYDQDGYLDLYITNSSRNNGSANEFYINNGDGTFSSGSDAGITSAVTNARSVNWIDYDNDNDLDLFVSNEEAANELYQNEDGEFTAVTTGVIATSESNSTGSSWADYDNDGDLDLYVANFGFANELFNNQGDGTFVRVTGESLVTGSDDSFGTAWGDIDNDGDLDLYVANGFKTGERVVNRLHINNGDGSFTEDTDHTTVAETGWSFGAAFGDYDNDGALDLFVANTFDESQTNSLYHNLGNDNHWLILDLEGTASNRSAIGAKVKVTATIDDVETTQMREISSQSSYNGQNSLRAHFGLGDATKVDEVEIIWPNGNSEILDNISIDEIIEAKESVPADFLRADFALSEDLYLAGSTIEFKDLSIYPEGESVTYEWDFDNDGEVDATEADATTSYNETGDYTVSLVVKYGDKSAKKIKTDYVKVRATLLDVEKKGIEPRMIVYPNPTTDWINFKSEFVIEKLEIRAIDGRLIKSQSMTTLGTSSLHLEALGLSPGQYTLIAYGNKTKEVVKLLIQK
ncbi:MAG: FG-GAP-like repeat-containing protein [Reichenbachiella sp.]|uniref:FG-GAP-like repeat-containing protein n=1 Tax=Reichenbachiella sp. TaxID=2184521 RepID=UPI00326452F7